MSQTQGEIMKSVNPDLQRERDASSFNTSELTSLMYGGSDALKRKNYVESILLNDPHFDQSGRFTASAAESFDRSIKRSVRWIAVKEEHNLNEPDDDFLMAGPMNSDSALMIHMLMFIPTIERLGSEEQKEKWLPLARKYKILGTYAQTELGHGTYLSGLETTATYDEETQEFILNSPTLTSMKWWPGALAKSSTHCILLAQLIVKGRKHGLHCFVVQVRSLETHQPLPGMTLGDIGLKSSFKGIDNGFLILDNVRIPRLNMLMKYAEVTPDGTFQNLGDPKVTYGSMLLVRTRIVQAASYEVSKALTVAVRYSIVRKQGVIERNGPEVSLLDYVTQQEKLLPGIACVFACVFVSKELRNLYLENESRLHESQDFSLLAELHALCSGLKAMMTKETVRHIDTCRFACGGHGVMLQSGLPEMYANFSPSCTYEGDNTVLLLQAAGYLIKTLSKVQAGETVGGLGGYLGEEPLERWSCDHQGQVTDGRLIGEAYKHRAQRLSRRAGERLALLIGRGLSQRQAWNQAGIDLVKAAEAHTQFFIVRTYYEGVQRNEFSPETRHILQKLCHLYALYHIEQNTGDFVADGFISSEQLDWLHGQYLDLLGEIRPEAAALVDSFNIRDEFLQSTLGCYDGNVYQRMYDYAKTDPKNRTEVHETYYKYLRPLLKGMIAKL